jgi:Ran GTPase-activating protein (RanGAP) involved in mRNA processing and transport
LGSEGAVHIINYGMHLQVLHLGKNYIKADCGRALTNLLKKSKVLKKLHLDFNELMVTGAKCIAQGLQKNTSLESLSIKGNVLGDQGI